MVWIVLYILIGLIIGFTIYGVCTAMYASKKSKNAARQLLDWVDTHLLLYVIFSAFCWPMYIKWILFRR